MLPKITIAEVAIAVGVSAPLNFMIPRFKSDIAQLYQLWVLFYPILLLLPPLTLRRFVKLLLRIGAVIPNPGWLNSFCERVRQTAEGRWQKGKKKKECNGIVGVPQPDLV